MTIAARTVAQLEQFDHASERLLLRMGGPSFDSGDGSPVEVPPMTDVEYLWEPVAGCWSVRRREDGPGHRATKLLGGGPWGRDATPNSPYPPPFTTLAWRLSHLTEMLVLRADHTSGTHSMERTDFHSSGDAAGAIAAWETATAAWRRTLLACDDEVLDTVGYSTFPYGSDADDPFIDVVWWVNQEIVHHGAEIALLRDLYREMHP